MTSQERYNELINAIEKDITELTKEIDSFTDNTEYKVQMRIAREVAIANLIRLFPSERDLKIHWDKVQGSKK